ARARGSAHRAAREQRTWDEALAALQEAAALDPPRFAPFPLDRYPPQRILGAGGFGIAFLCKDARSGESVVVKALHDADLERGADEALRLAPRATPVFGTRAAAHLGKKDVDRAIADASEALRLD